MLTNVCPFFHPKFTHQVFHRDETIKGMKDLSVNLYLSPTTLRPYLYWCCSDYGQQYDDITNILKISFGPNILITDRSQFNKILEQETLQKFKLPGKKITSFKRNVPNSQCNPPKTLQSFNLQQIQKAARKGKAQFSPTQTKTFEVVKIKGDSEYFKEINRRF